MALQLSDRSALAGAPRRADGGSGGLLVSPLLSARRSIYAPVARLSQELALPLDSPHGDLSDWSLLQARRRLQGRGGKQLQLDISGGCAGCHFRGDTWCQSGKPGISARIRALR